MISIELLTHIEKEFKNLESEIKNINQQGLQNTHLIGNKDSQSCVTYPPIAQLKKHDFNVYSKENKNKNTLYIHIPFCTGICSYCSYVVKKSSEGSSEIDIYLDYLEKELQLILKSLDVKIIEVETIYIGGGTPSILSDVQLKKLFSIIKKYIQVNGEFSLETSPETVTLEKIKIAKDHGVNRISMGVETWNDKILKNIMRRHDKSVALKAIDIFQKEQIMDIDIDLIRGLPGQTKKILIDDLIFSADLNIPSITNYQYNIKPKSVDFKKITPRGYDVSSYNLNFYAFAVYTGLETLGYQAGPPLGWFLKNNSIYEHNFLKWKNQYNQLCIGVSSYGYYEGKMFANTSNINEYISLLNKNILPISANTELTPDEIVRRHFIFSLKSDVDIDFFKKVYNFDLLGSHDISYQIQHLEKIKCVEIKNNKIFLTDTGRLFVDQILMTFYNPEYKNNVQLQ